MSLLGLAASGTLPVSLIRAALAEDAALLVQQAALSFAHFTGIVPDAALCRDILQELEAAQ